MGARGVLRVIEGAQLGFLCPGCECMHVVDSGWTFDGNYEKPTFSPSVLVRSGHYAEGSEAAKLGHCWCNFNQRYPDQPQSRFRCIRCHSFVKAGQIEFLADSTHALAGKTVALEPFGE